MKNKMWLQQHFLVSWAPPVTPALVSLVLSSAVHIGSGMTDGCSCHWDLQFILLSSAPPPTNPLSVRTVELEKRKQDLFFYRGFSFIHVIFIDIFLLH